MRRTRTIGVLPEPPPEGGFGKGLAAFAKQLWWERRWRTRFFPAELFGEPSWDMLLAGYATEEGGASREASGMRRPHVAACSPPRVASRHVRALAGLHLLEAGADGRGAVPGLELTSEARERMGMLLGNILLQRSLSLLPPSGTPGGDAADGKERDQNLRLTLLMARLLESLEELDRLDLPEAGAHLSLAIATLERHAGESSRARR